MVIGGSEDQRFTPVIDVLKQIDSSHPTTYQINPVDRSRPVCRIQVNPRESRFTLLVEGDSSIPELATFLNISAAQVTDNGVTWSGIHTNWTHSPIELYSLLITLVDRIQSHGETLATAFTIGIAGLKDILRHQSKLDRESQIGLLGELITLTALVESIGPKKAVKSWVGPEGEECDFTTRDVNYEVKTTSSETRIHRIATLTQLRGNDDQQLRLVSIQVTQNAGQTSTTLSRAVETVRQLVGPEALALNTKLARVGFLDEHFDLYTETWSLRSKVQEYTINESFPRIIPESLTHMTLESSRISDVQYRINLHDYEVAVPTLNWNIDIPGSVEND